MNPKISVVMPTYNRAKIIQHAIRSVIDQTFKDWELIIVDDGSEDETKRIVEQFANPRIKYIKIPHCGFVSKVRNEGTKLAKGEIIVVHDSDDVAFPDRLDEVVTKFEETKADVVYHGMYMRFYDPYTNSVARMIRPALPYSKERLLKEQYIPGQIAYTKKLWEKVPYDERIKCCDDYQILLEFCLNNAKFVPLYKNLYEYSDSPDSINVSGEADGSRKQDVLVILDILKKKYGLDSHATLIKNTLSGQLISKEDL